SPSRSVPSGRRVLARGSALSTTALTRSRRRQAVGDYTPSTDDVRTQYIGTTPDRAHHPHEIKRREQIDRWLTAHEKAVRADERERIAQRIEARMRENDASGAQVRAGDAYADAARIARE